VCSSLSSVLVAVPPSLLRRCSALPHTVALHVVALLIAEVVVAPILIGSLRGCRRIVPRTSLHSLAVVCAPHRSSLSRRSSQAQYSMALP
jgi:hypothetical protein